MFYVHVYCTLNPAFRSGRGSEPELRGGEGRGGGGVKLGGGMSSTPAKDCGRSDECDCEEGRGGGRGVGTEEGVSSVRSCMEEWTLVTGWGSGLGERE